MKLNQQIDPLIDKWKAFVQSSDYTLVEKCLKLSKLLEYQNLNEEEYLQKINHFTKSLKKSLTKNDQNYLITKLNEFLFDYLGFKGDKEDYYNPKNNFLNDVIDKKSGIPITLSIIYSHIAKQIGLEMKIIGFPTHVITKCGELLLDPYNEGTKLQIDDLQEILDKSFGGQIEMAPELLAEINHERVLSRMVRNLKNSYIESYAYDKALQCTNMILSLEKLPEEIRDKGIIENQLLNHDSSIKHLNEYLELNPNAEDADFVLELIRGIREKINR